MPAPKFGNHFGPLQNIAIAHALLEYINVTRKQQNLKLISVDEFIALVNHIEAQLDKLDWLSQKNKQHHE